MSVLQLFLKLLRFLCFRVFPYPLEKRTSSLYVGSFYEVDYCMKVPICLKEIESAGMPVVSIFSSPYYE